MAISPLSGAAPATFTGAGTSPTGSFGKALKGTLEGSPTPVQPSPTQARTSAQAAPGTCRVEASRVEGTGASTAARVLDQVSAAQGRMDAILSLAESGKSFSPAELLSLQAHVYRASQELDLAGKVVEKATGGVKQVLQTQV
jgi:hypothetical protein